MASSDCEEDCIITIGEYEYCLTDQLGEGGYGTVYKGCQTATGQQVALKKMLTEQVKQSELDSIAKVQSSFVVTIMEIFASTAPMENCTFMVMELCDTDLDQFIKTYGKLSGPNLDTIAKCLAQGYLTLHVNQVVHRDIKPHNILLNLKIPTVNSRRNSAVIFHVTPDMISNDHNENGQPMIDIAKFADFGLSRSQATENDRLSNLAGTLFYMAPEVGANLVNMHLYDEGADMWSLGVVLYECACGILPLSEQQLCKLFLRAMERNYCGYVPPEIFGTVADKYKLIVSRLLCLDPSNRLNPTEFHTYVVQENLGSLFRSTQNGQCSTMANKVKNNNNNEGGLLKRTSSELFARLLSLVK